MFEKQEKNKKYINLLFIVLAAVVVFVSIIVLISNQVKCQDKLEEKKRLEAEASAISERVGEKQNRLDRPLDSDYIAEVVRDKLDMHYPDEGVYYGDDKSSNDKERTTETESEKAPE